jgi:hypothetical protein
MDEELLHSTVPRALETKTKLFGFELPDLLLIFLNLSVTNLVFGASSFRYLLVWGTSLGLAVLLFFGKRGKPDGYLQHLVQFHLNPSYRAAGRADLRYRRFRKGAP